MHNIIKNPIRFLFAALIISVLVACQNSKEVFNSELDSTNAIEFRNEETQTPQEETGEEKAIEKSMESEVKNELPQADSETKEMNGDLVYKNDEYGFSLTFPKTWEGYRATKRVLNWGALGESDSFDFSFVGADSLFNISVFPKERWAALQKEGGLRPSYLGENATHVFGYAAAPDANETMAKRLAEVNEIVKSFKAQ